MQTGVMRRKFELNLVAMENYKYNGRYDRRLNAYAVDCPRIEGLSRDMNLKLHDRSLHLYNRQSDSGDDYGNSGNKKKPGQISHRIIEKRRRDRMNNCLADLSKLIPTTYLRKNRGRVEKTEIIEMAIRHIRSLTDGRRDTSEQVRPPPGWTDVISSAEGLVELKQESPSNLDVGDVETSLSVASSPVELSSTSLGTSVAQVLQQSASMDRQQFRKLTDQPHDYHLLNGQCRDRLANDCGSGSRVGDFVISSAPTSPQGRREPLPDSPGLSGSLSPKCERLYNPCMLPGKQKLLQRYNAEQVEKNASSTSSARSSPERHLKRDFPSNGSLPLKKQRLNDKVDKEVDVEIIKQTKPPEVTDRLNQHYSMPKSLDTILPAFVMHPSGHYYVPVTIPQCMMGNLLTQPNDKIAVTYPISINVKIGVPGMQSGNPVDDPYFGSQKWQPYPGTPGECPSSPHSV